MATFVLFIIYYLNDNYILHNYFNYWKTWVKFCWKIANYFKFESGEINFFGLFLALEIFKTKETTNKRQLNAY